MFCNFYLMKSRKFGSESTTTQAREKISTDLESLNFRHVLLCLTKFKNNQILLHRISHRFLQMTKPFTRRKSLIIRSFVITNHSFVLKRQRTERMCFVDKRTSLLSQLINYNSKKKFYSTDPCWNVVADHGLLFKRIIIKTN